MVISAIKVARVHTFFAQLPRATSPPSPHHRFLSQLFSSTYKSLFPQLLSFLIYTKHPGVGFPQRSNVQRSNDLRKSFRIRSYAKSASNSFRIRFYEKWPGVEWHFISLPKSSGCADVETFRRSAVFSSASPSKRATLPKPAAYGI